MGYGRRNKVLKKMGFASYEEYLGSELWARIKAAGFETHGTTCLVCGNKANCLHHVHYEEPLLRGDTVRGLVPICRGCHQTVEFDEDGAKRSIREAKVKLAEVGGERIRCLGVVDKVSRTKKRREAEAKIAVPVHFWRFGECIKCHRPATVESYWCRHCSAVLAAGR